MVLSMLVSKKIGDPERDHFQGILDGFYAIALTFLTLDLPNQIQYLFERQLSLPRSSVGVEAIVVLFFLSHIFIFIILFEILCLHKAIIKINPNTLFVVRLTVVVMALVSLAPVLIHVINHLRQQIVFLGETPALLRQLGLLRRFLWGDLSAIYLVLLIMNKFSLRDHGGCGMPEAEQKSRRAIHRVLAVRCSFTLFYLYCVTVDNAIARFHPLLGFLVLVLIVFTENGLGSLLRFGRFALRRILGRLS